MIMRVAVFLVIFFALATPGLGEPLSEATQKNLERNWQLCLVKKKGPFSANTCVCRDGSQEMVRKVNGKLVIPCGGAFVWCEAFRSDWGRALAEEGVWIGNLFQRDLYEWESIDDPQALVQGYALEQFVIESNPGHKLDELRAYGGLSGAEYEARALPLFLDRHVTRPAYDPDAHHLATFELLRRFRVRDDQKEIVRVRNASSAIQAKNRDFKPYRDRTHNQISASLVPILKEYRAGLSAGNALAAPTGELIIAIEVLVLPTDETLQEAIVAVPDDRIRHELQESLVGFEGSPADRTTALGRVLVSARRAMSHTASRRRLLEVGVDAYGLLQKTIESAPAAERRDLAQGSAVDAAFGAGQLTETQWGALRSDVAAGDASAMSALAERMTRNVEGAYATVLPQWRHVAPSVERFAASVVRGSPAGLSAKGEQ